MTSHTVPLVVTALSRHCGGYLAASSLTFLKPRFKRFLMPVSARLARAGVVANQVTTVSIVGSLIMGGMLSLFHSHSILFGLLPVWILVRMGCATIDGTLAIDFGQKSRLGGVLNEVGDVVSDVVLFLPLASVVPFSASSVGTVVVLAISSEVAGMLGPALGGSRRVDGPMGKADRGIALGILGLWTCCGGPLPSEGGLGHAAVWMPARDHDRQSVVSRADRGARGRQMTHGCSEVGSHPAPPSRRNAATDKTLVMRHVERLVGDGHATWRQRRGRALELTLATGEVFRLGKTTVTRIF
jgi:CDP-diacylglycerol---glycerol-3-phosphate 3-phosphatidyltransferase